MMKHQIGKRSVFRRVIRLGNSLALSLPAKWVSEWEYVVVELRDGEIVVRPVAITERWDGGSK
jgi:antitoxin component of MazEF toxin-antitoxin module